MEVLVHNVEMYPIGCEFRSIACTFAYVLPMEAICANVCHCASIILLCTSVDPTLFNFWYVIWACTPQSKLLMLSADMCWSWNLSMIPPIETTYMICCSEIALCMQLVRYWSVGESFSSNHIKPTWPTGGPFGWWRAWGGYFGWWRPCVRGVIWMVWGSFWLLTGFVFVEGC